MVKIVQDRKNDIEKAAHHIKNGGVVIFPTETVYGIGANVFDQKAVEQIYTIKKRPQDNPLICHFHSVEHILEHVGTISALEKIIMDTFMPGPLTMLVENKTIPLRVTAGQTKVGVRVPDNNIAQTLLQASGVPICAPSANPSGQPSATSIAMIEKYFAKNDDMLAIDGGVCDYGIESTIIVVEGSTITVLRPGYVTAEDILGVVGKHGVEVQFGKSKETTPGSKYRHYSPEAKVVVGSCMEIISEIQKRNPLSYTILTVQPEQYTEYSEHVMLWGDTYAECAKNLYQHYFDADRDSLDIIFVERLELRGLGISIMNRVMKSAS